MTTNGTASLLQSEHDSYCVTCCSVHAVDTPAMTAVDTFDPKEAATLGRAATAFWGDAGRTLADVIRCASPAVFTESVNCS